MEPHRPHVGRSCLLACLALRPCPRAPEISPLRAWGHVPGQGDGSIWWAGGRKADTRSILFLTIAGGNKHLSDETVQRIVTQGPNLEV